MQEDSRRRWWRGCLPRPTTQTKKPRDESRGFRKWRLPTLPQRSAVPSAMLSLSLRPLSALCPRPSPLRCLPPLPAPLSLRSLSRALSRAPQARTAHTPHGSLRAHTAPHSATQPPMRHTRGGKRRLFLPGQKRYGLSQKRSIGLSFFRATAGRTRVIRVRGLRG